MASTVDITPAGSTRSSSVSGVARARPARNPRRRGQAQSGWIDRVPRERVAFLLEHDLRPKIDQVLPLEAAAAAHERLEAKAVQGRIAAWIEKIDGSYTGIMGLPLFETTQLLSRARVRLDL